MPLNSSDISIIYTDPFADINIGDKYQLIYRDNDWKDKFWVIDRVYEIENKSLDGSRFKFVGKDGYFTLLFISRFFIKTSGKLL